MARVDTAEHDGMVPEVIGRLADLTGLDGLRARQSVEAENRGGRKEAHAVDGVQQELPSQHDKTWSGYIATASGLDLVSSGLVLIIAFSYAYRDAGVSLYCLGLQTTAHWLSSLLLLLRFAGERGFQAEGPEAQSILRERRRSFLLREQGLNVGMALLMLVSSVALLFKAFRKLRFWDRWYQDHQRMQMDEEAQRVIEGLAWYGFAVYVLQAVFRLVAARKLKRNILWNGFAASTVSLVFLFVLGFSASYQKEWSWKAEPFAAIFLAFVTLFEGVRISVANIDDMDARLRYDPCA